MHYRKQCQCKHSIDKIVVEIWELYFFVRTGPVMVVVDIWLSDTLPSSSLPSGTNSILSSTPPSVGIKRGKIVKIFYTGNVS